MSKKVLSLKEAKKYAEQILKKHNEIVKLRAKVLPAMRETIKENAKKVPEWMERKVRMGYFGTDVRNAEIIKLFDTLEKAISKK